MKLTKLTHLVVLAVVLTIAGSGCKKKPQYVTTIPGAKTGSFSNPEPGPAAGLDKTPGGGDGIKSTTEPTGPRGFGDKPGHDGWAQNPEIFKSYTVHFDFDRSAVKGAELTKVQSVAEHLKSNPSQAVRVDGHCDERGTEEYNRALGERRALAIREELIKLGIDSTRVDTMTLGKDRPADPGHSDSAHQKNRRGEFILLSPPSA